MPGTSHAVEFVRQPARYLLPPMRGPREDEPALWQTYPRAKVGVDFLLTWNIRHLANAAMRRRIEAACREAGFAAPVLCTPEELMEG